MAPVKGLLKKSERKSHLHTIGNREIETHGLDTCFWRDLYHRSLTVYLAGVLWHRRRNLRRAQRRVRFLLLARRSSDR